MSSQLYSIPNWIGPEIFSLPLTFCTSTWSILSNVKPNLIIYYSSYDYSLDKNNQWKEMINKLKNKLMRRRKNIISTLNWIVSIRDCGGLNTIQIYKSSKQNSRNYKNLPKILFYQNFDES